MHPAAMMSDMRVFVAVEPPADVVDDLDAFLDARRDAGDGLRWTPPSQWHLTLAFMAAAPERVVEDLVGRLGEAVERSGPVGRRPGRGGPGPPRPVGALRLRRRRGGARRWALPRPPHPRPDPAPSRRDALGPRARVVCRSAVVGDRGGRRLVPPSTGEGTPATPRGARSAAARWLTGGLPGTCRDGIRRPGSPRQGSRGGGALPVEQVDAVQLSTSASTSPTTSLDSAVIGSRTSWR